MWPYSGRYPGRHLGASRVYTLSNTPLVNLISYLVPYTWYRAEESFGPDGTTGDLQNRKNSARTELPSCARISRIKLKGRRLNAELQRLLYNQTSSSYLIRFAKKKWDPSPRNRHFGMNTLKTRIFKPKLEGRSTQNCSESKRTSFLVPDTFYKNLQGSPSSPPSVSNGTRGQ